VAAPVRRAVSSIESITARTRPSAASQSITSPWMVGSPRAGLLAKLPFVFTAK
jgi:hypothetical protein